MTYKVYLRPGMEVETEKVDTAINIADMAFRDGNKGVVIYTKIGPDGWFNENIWGRYLTKAAQPVYDRLGREIKAGDIVSVQKAGTYNVESIINVLYFRPYGRLQRVCDYFQNDLEKVE